MGRIAVVACLLVVIGLVQVASGLALSCPTVPVTQRLDEVDAAFIGKVLSERPDPDVPGGYVYRFSVIEELKGGDTLGSQIDVRTPARLVSTTDEPLVGYDDLDVGVMLKTDESTPTTNSCDLAPPLDLVSAVDEPKGNAIKVVIGMIILLLVLVYATVRLKRKQLRQQQEAGS